MSLNTRVALVREPGLKPEILTAELVAPGHDEALVRLIACGVCHTDVAWAKGGLFDRFPVVLGHECAGIVEQVGPSVTRVRPGDRVVLALSHSCGHCRYCESARPMLCTQRTESPTRLRLDGEPLVQAFGTGGFAEHTVVREASLVKVPDAVPLPVAALVGCATSTGLGSVFNLAKVQYGTTVAVLGAGAIGLSVLLGCRVAGADRIVVVDPDPGRRRKAVELGATDVLGPDEAAVRELEPQGFEYVFESAGRADVMESAIRLTARGGTAVLMGVVPPGTTIQVDAREFVPSQRRILGCLTGNVRPHLDFDRYFRLYQRGLLDLDSLLTSTVALDDISTGFQRCDDGEGIRTLVSLGEE